MTFSCCENTAYAEKTSVKFLLGVSDFSNLFLQSLTVTKTNGQHRPYEAASGTVSILFTEEFPQVGNTVMIKSNTQTSESLVVG